MFCLFHDLAPPEALLLFLTSLASFSVGYGVINGFIEAIVTNKRDIKVELIK